MKTITVQIGNSDDKLTQSEWHSFVRAVKSNIEPYIEQIYFFGAPPNYEQWQNACWVIGCEDENIADLKEIVAHIRHTYKQDSIAWTEGETVFI